MRFVNLETGNDLACIEPWQPLWFRGFILLGSEHLGFDQQFSLGTDVGECRCNESDNYFLKDSSICHASAVI